jgi:ribulose-5-phosphate 4-epimerase/fuculose-1-phosphate aldolase
MNVHENLPVPSLENKVSPEEWQTRIDLAACYRLVANFGWSDLIFTHISARVPGTEGQFLINPYGMMFDEITASSLVKIDLHCNKLDDSRFPVNPAGFTIHSAIHAMRHDAHCVLHVHSVNGVAVSAQKRGLLPLSQQSIFVLSSLAYHDYEGVALNDDEKPRLVADLGKKTYLMLRNHGLLTVGKTIADAFLNMYIFETACMIQVRAQAGGGELISIPQAIIDEAQRQAKAVTNSAGGMLAWPALLRRLERLDSSYRT